ncbi:class I SAM-dependent methyltransferase [Streptomyces sp. NPDC017529]|uniref:class I SAM-dependent methyltransferase n=1 Tax=Streptomyces sp. NPDC017529 TaxID=3365000 RepID=UPI0037A79300
MAGPTTSGLGAPDTGYRRRAHFYDVEYRTTEDHGYLQRLVTDRVRSILEIPSGSGRNADWLIAAGRRVVCADLEPGMVDQVRARIEKAAAQDRVTAVQADMRELDLPERFDLILVPQEAFQLLHEPGDAERALPRLASHLRPGGTLLLDLHTFDSDGSRAGSRARDVSPLPDYFDPRLAEGRVVTEWRRPVPPTGWLERARSQHSEGSRMRIVYDYRFGEGDRELDRWTSSIRMRRYTADGIADLAARSGLRIQRMALDYAGTPWVPGAARMVTHLCAASEEEER